MHPNHILLQVLKDRNQGALLRNPHTDEILP